MKEIARLEYPAFHGRKRFMVTEVDDLPTMNEINSEALIIDFETTSGDRKKDSLAPFEGHCFIAGIAIMGLGRDTAYYVPLRHNAPYNKHNLPREAVRAWLVRVFEHFKGKPWINANVKYDVQAMFVDLGLDHVGPLVDIQASYAKLIDSDRVYRGGYGLDALMRMDLGIDITYLEAKIKQYLNGSQDYGDIDPVAMADYATVDVISVDMLYHHYEAIFPPESRGVQDTEIKVTRVLTKMERRGIGYNPDALYEESTNTMNRMLACQATIYKESGKLINPGSPQQVYNLLCNYYGLPVLKHTLDAAGNETENPSFGKAAMLEYLGLPNCPTKVVEAIRDYRLDSKFRSAFLQVFQEAGGDDNVLHGSYNQSVRTGRLSCVRPNNMQFNDRAKKLIVPAKGNGFLSLDQSLIEFRLIVHYIRDQKAIAAFAQNADTDFHQWVADLCGCPRKSAKVINFLSAYGGGKKKTLLALAAIDVVRDLIHEACTRSPGWDKMSDKDQLERFGNSLQSAAERTHDAYHRALPTLKRVASRAQRICWDRGHVINLLGRQRHLPREIPGKKWSPTKDAFNSLCQSSAADLVKWQMVQIDEALEGLPLWMNVQVHDEILTEGDQELVSDPRTKRDLAAIMEETPPYIREPLLVPLRAKGGYSLESWSHAGADGNTSTVSPDEIKKAERMEWAKR